MLLLDEPGTNLHAMGQTDFLRLIKERLATRNQVVYSTHSPFMVDLESLESVRLVEDLNGSGTVVSDDVLSNDSETVFPLQVALGYRMAERLFLAPHVLMVNNPSDTVYLQVLGDVVAANSGARLDPRWVLIPVGAAENVPIFVSLLSEDHTTVAVLMDVTPTKKERVEKLTRDGKPHHADPIRWVEVTRVRDADIEDLFEPDFYLRLVNRAYEGVLPSELTRPSISDSNPRIAERVASYFKKHDIDGGVFDRNRPAAYLLGKHSQLRDEIDETTVERASALFNRVNALLPLTGATNGAGVQSIGLHRTRAVA